MASQWFCKVLGQEVGPVGFQDLVEMVRAGTLTEGDPVRRQGTSEWTRARDVIGLFRTAQKQKAQPVPSGPRAKPKRPPTPTAAQGGEQPAPTSRRIGRRHVLLMSGIGLAVLVLVALGFVWRSQRSPRFPEPQLGKPRPADEESLAASRAPPPKVPSVPGLEERVPKLVPGLEEFNAVQTASLSADLRTVVFSAAEKLGGNCDLYLATRANVSDPFGEPKPIESCNTGKWETNAALSPDGLDLIFVRPYVKGHFFCARRSSASSEFGEPIPWPTPGWDPEKQRVGHPRFCGPLCLLVNVVESAPKKQTYLMARRAAPNTVFDAPLEIDLGSFGARAFLSQDGLRYYFGSPNGIFMGARKTETEPFNYRGLLIDAEVSGPTDVPLWVAPQEDVIFYCSPGPGEELGSTRGLWMIRF